MEDFSQNLMKTYKIGIHFSREGKSIHSILSALPNDFPFQCFLGSPLNTKLNVSQLEITKTLETITTGNKRIFVHSPYVINLSTPIEEKNGYHITCLNDNLKYSVSMGMKGVVVHVGKSLKTKVDVALDIMKKNILISLNHASVGCQILLETPAKMGSETLTKIEDFISFCKSINDKRFGICVDTCHVFASGYMPSEYLMQCIESELIPKLIHFNDSKKEKGCCLDRHEAIGLGCIPREDLIKCAEIGKKYNIPMVYE